MAEVESQNAIVPMGEVMPSETPTYKAHIVDVGAGGEKQTLDIPLADHTDWQRWSLIARAALLKKTTWKNSTLPEIIYACLYADKLGLDIVAGDVYGVDGRLNTTAGAKIKYAMKSGRVKGYSYKIEEVTNDGKPVILTLPKGQNEKVQLPELEITVSVTLTDWAEPFEYRARLSEWYQPRNPNWYSRPRYMLSRNAVGHAMDMVVPTGSAESDEAPPMTVAVPGYDEVKGRQQSKTNGKEVAA